MRKLRRFLCGSLFPCALLALAALCGGVLIVLLLPRAFLPFAAAERLFSLLAGIAVSLGTDGAEYKLLKVFLALLLPWAGGIFCLLSLCGRERDEGGISECSAERFEYFPLGADMRARLFADIAGAKERVWLQYYIVAEGKFSGELLSLLEGKAREGADVRFMYDGFGCSLTLPKGFQKRLRGMGVAVKELRRVRFSLSSARREHRKIAVVDGIAYTGGVNLSDEYVGETVRFGHWKDTAVRVEGSAANELARLFALRWGEGLADKIPKLPGKGFPCTVFYDGAGKGEKAGGKFLERLVSSSKKVYLFTPYLAPEGALLSALKGAARAGADIKLMLPHIPDKKLPFLLSRSYARELVRAGVQVREYAAGFLHAKSVLTERGLAVSSYNLDFRSFYLQSECGVYLSEEGTVREAERDFLSCWEQGVPLKRQSLPVRAAALALRLFAPLV